MRNPFISTLAITLIASAILALSVTTDLGYFEDSESLANHYAMSTERAEEWPAGTFFVSTASWDEESRQLIVRAKTLQEKGTFLTLSGIPASTWVDAFTISSDHAADFQPSAIRWPRHTLPSDGSLRIGVHGRSCKERTCGV